MTTTHTHAEQAETIPADHEDAIQIDDEYMDGVLREWESDGDGMWIGRIGAVVLEMNGHGQRAAYRFCCEDEAVTWFNRVAECL